MFKDDAELSKLSIAKRIAEREKVVSQINWSHNDCLPTAVAFTHGLPHDYHEIGLHARAFVHQAIDASYVLAERSNESVHVNKFVVNDRQQTLGQISNKLKQSDKAWIIFGNKEDSHVLGSLKLGDDEYIVVNLNSDRPYAKMTASEIADYLIDCKKYSDLGACVISFKKNK
jgi:hypothetical protein